MKSRKLFQIIGLIDDELIEHAQLKKINKKSNYLKWGSLAAGTILILTLGLVNYINPLDPMDVEIPNLPPIASEMGVRKFFNYNSYRYAFLNDGAQFPLTNSDLGQSLGNLDQDSAATFASGGTLYQTTLYDSEFRLAVEYDGKFYLAEIVANADDSPFPAKQYLDMSKLNVYTSTINILTHSGDKTLYQINDQEMIHSFISKLYTIAEIDLTDEDYEAIGAAQSQGKSYQLEFALSDETVIQMYIIPELRSISIGDNLYELSEDFVSDFEDIFTNLEQVIPPLY